MSVNQSRVYRTSYLVTLFFSIVLFAVPAFSQGKGIELPVEFFFGRWAPGLVSTGEGNWHGDYPPLWTAGASYSTDRYRVGVRGLVGRAAPFVTVGHTEGKSGFFFFRPNSRWELAVEDISDRVDTWDQGPSVHYADTHTSLVLSVRASRTSETSLSPQMAEYVYFGGRAIGDGQFLWHALAYYQSNSHEIVAPNLLIPRSIGRTKEYAPIITDFVWGVSHTVVFDVSAALEISRWTDTSVFRPFPPTTTAVERKYQFDRPSVDLGGLIQLRDNQFVRLELSQQFVKSSEEGASVYINHPDTIFEITPHEDNIPLKNESTRLSVELTSFSAGAFDSRVILDDYLGYYRHMLFEDQQRIVLGCYYEVQPEDGLWDRENSSIYLSFARGLNSQLELSGRLEYEWNTYGRVSPVFRRVYANEYVRYRAGLRWRSYAYEAGRGPGWGRDSAIDIAFGPMLQAGQSYLSLEVIPPYLHFYHMGTSTGFLAMSKLEGTGNLTFGLDGEIGLGKQLTIAGEVVFEFEDNFSTIVFSPDGEGRVNLRLTKRLFEMFQLRFGLFHEFSEGSDRSSQFWLSAAGLFW